MSTIPSFSAGAGTLNPIPISMVTADAPLKTAQSHSAQTNSNGSGSAPSSGGGTSNQAATPSRTAEVTYSGSGGSMVSAAVVAQLTSLETFSTDIGGKQYSESLQESGGEYTASVPNLPGATATGASELQAEESLYARIDVMA